jgi:hypothetical protein
VKPRVSERNRTAKDTKGAKGESDLAVLAGKVAVGTATEEEKKKRFRKTAAGT